MTTKKTMYDELARLEAERDEARQSAREERASRERCADLLTRTATALKGQAPPGVWHDWSDLPDVALRLRQQADPRCDGCGRGFTVASDAHTAGVVLCPACMSPGLVGVREGAAILGLNAGNFSRLHKRRPPGFPAPAVELACGPIWRRADIEGFVPHMKRRRRKNERG